MAKRRIVITGIGLLSSVGNGREAFWESCLAGAAGAAPIAIVPSDDLSSKLAAPVQPFDAKALVGGPNMRRMDRFAKLNVGAVRLALQDSGFTGDSATVGLVLSTTFSAWDSTDIHTRTMVKDGPGEVSPIVFPNIVLNSAQGHVALMFGLKGVCSTLTGTSALAYAYDLIQRGCGEIIVAGAGDELPGNLIRAYSKLGLAAHDAGFGESSRPFDLHRNGWISGEGMFVVTLETLEHAQERGATIYAEVMGYGATVSLAEHSEQPALEEDGSSLAYAMKQAMEMAGLKAGEISLVEAAANSTRAFDAAEASAIDRLFPGGQVAVHALKGATGEVFGGGSIAGVIAAALALKHGVVPPTVGYREPDPSLPALGLAREARRADLDAALVNAVEIGGSVISIALKRFGG